MINNIQNNYKSPTFTSRIEFVSGINFRKAVRRLKPDTVKEMIHFSEVKKIDFAARIKGVISCLGGVIQGIPNKAKRIFHFHTVSMLGLEDPMILYETQRFEHFLSRIPKNRKVKGVVIGGMSSRHNNVTSDYCKRFFDMFKRPFEKNRNADFTIFYGHNNPLDTIPNSNLLYDNSNDTYIINCGFRKNHCKTQEILTPDALHNHFEYIHISPNDEVYINGKKIPNELLNT